MFDLDEFAAACRVAIQDPEPRHAVREVVERAVASPAEVAEALQPTEGGLRLVSVGPDLTVLHLVWAPGMVLFPHDHRMWAVIGIYTGREDNAFFRRSAPGARTLVESGAKQLDAGNVLVLGDDTIHAVSNSQDRLTGALHVYGGDFVSQPRSQWGPGPREERPYDMDDVYRQFADANRAWATRGRVDVETP